MWAEALAEKERTKDGGSREAESRGGMKETKMELVTLMKQLFFFLRSFGRNAGITEPL